MVKGTLDSVIELYFLMLDNNLTHTYIIVGFSSYLRYVLYYLSGWFTAGVIVPSCIHTHAEGTIFFIDFAVSISLIA